MMVTMDRPFVWPEVPAKEELKTSFDAERYKKLSDDRERQMQGAPDMNKIDKERQSIAEQAQRLIEGKDRWKDVDPSVPQGTALGKWSMPLR